MSATDYAQLPSGFWTKNDGSGPYVRNADGTFSIAGSGGGGGGGGAVTMASGAVASGAYASGSIASGAVASGAYASGSISDGADVTLGAKADAAAGTDGATATFMALFKRLLGKILPGQQTTANSLSVGPASDSANFPVSNTGRRVRLSITRPANTTPYSANDVIGTNSTAALTFASIGAANGHILLTSIDLLHEVTAIPAGMTSFRLYLYNATPPSALADNAAFDLAAGDLTAYIGYVDFGIINDLGSNLFVQADNVLKQVQCDSSGNLYGYLVTNGSWTPGANSTVFDIVLRSINC
jgi:hypothetical protein